MKRSCLHFSADLKSLEPLLRFVAENARRAGVDEEQLPRIELALEEAVVNISHYAYRGKAGDLEVCCSATVQGLKVRLGDEGIPFNPLAAPEVNVSADITSREIGGLGIHLMRNMADKLHYRREGGRNLLTLDFLRHAPEGP